MLARWHWEFLRRNQQYRQDYVRFAALSPKDDAEQGQREKIAARYGLDGIMHDPGESLDSLFESPRDPAKIRLVHWQTTWTEDDHGQLSERDLEDSDYLDPKLRQHECCVVFNLRNPSDVQLRQARIRLEQLQRRFQEKRGRVKDYAYYLRLLDAETSGITSIELAEYFWPDLDRRMSLRRIEQDLDTAIRLRDEYYRYI